MNRDDFQALSRLRKTEAKALLDAAQYTGSYYLMGYAVECALKACIAKTVRRNDFPEKDTSGFYTHNLERLMQSAQLQPAYQATVQLLPALAVNWATVKEWRETLRYRPQLVTEVEAKDFYRACTARRSGVLTWVAQKW